LQIAFDVLLVLAGLGLALAASDRAVAYTRALAVALRAPAFVVGVALVSIGTDLPEIANSISAHAQGEGDINVGDSVGSTLTQYTFVLALFPLVVAVVAIDRRQIGIVSLLTICGLGLTALFVLDGWLGRLEGVVLVAAWAVFTLVVIRVAGGHVADIPPKVRHDHVLAQAAMVIVTLALVGAGATIAVHSLAELAEEAGVPEFALAFFGASMGTSAPEIVVDITALRRGAPGIALGDALGSSLVDSTLSIGIGPALFPAEVTPRLALTGTLYAIAAVAIVGTVLAVRRRHDRRTGLLLAALYGLAYVVLIQAA
jgi:cation:H+ antiporter